LEDHKHAPDFDACLFSLMKPEAIEKGWTLSDKGTNIVLTKKNTTVVFDRNTKTKDGILCGVELLPRLGEQATPASDVQEPQELHPRPHQADNTEPPESESGGEGTGNADDPDAGNSNSNSKHKPKPVHWNVNRFHSDMHLMKQ